MPEYRLIKDGVMVNKIVSDESFIETIRSDYDLIELVNITFVPIEPEPEQPSNP